VPLFTMQGVEGQIFGPMARNLWLRARRCAARHLHGGRRFWRRFCFQGTSRKPKPSSCRPCARVTRRCFAGRSAISKVAVMIGIAFLGVERIGGIPARHANYCRRWRRANFWIRAAMPSTMSLDAGTAVTGRMREILLRQSRVSNRRVAARPPGQWQRCFGLSPTSELFAPLNAVRRVAGESDKGKS